MRYEGFVVCYICDFACALRLAVRLQFHYLHFHCLFNTGNQLPRNTNKGYLKSSRDATRYYTNIPKPGRGKCSQYSNFRQTLRQTSRTKRKVKRGVRRETKEEEKNEEHKRAMLLKQKVLASCVTHHITTHPASTLR